MSGDCAFQGTCAWFAMLCFDRDRVQVVPRRDSDRYRVRRSHGTLLNASQQSSDMLAEALDSSFYTRCAEVTMRPNAGNIRPCLSVAITSLKKVNWYMSSDRHNTVQKSRCCAFHLPIFQQRGKRYHRSYSLTHTYASGRERAAATNNAWGRPTLSVHLMHGC